MEPFNINIIIKNDKLIYAPYNIYRTDINLDFYIKIGDISKLQKNNNYIVNSFRNMYSENGENVPQRKLIGGDEFKISYENFLETATKTISLNVNIPDDKYFLPNVTYSIFTVDGGGTYQIKGYKFKKNTSNLIEQSNCSILNNDINSCITSFSRSNNERCIYDFSDNQCINDNTNDVEYDVDNNIYYSKKPYNPKIFCDNDTGTVKNNKTLVPIENCTNFDITTNCDNYYMKNELGMFQRCKIKKDGVCDISNNNEVTINDLNVACSKYSVFKNNDALKSAIDQSTAEDKKLNISTVISNKYGEINEWDISHIDNTSDLFKDKIIENVDFDISKWNTKNIKYADSMFQNSNIINEKFNVSDWNMENVTNCYNFNNATIKQKINLGFNCFHILEDGNFQIGLNDSFNLQTFKLKLNEIFSIRYLESTNQFLIVTTTFGDIRYIDSSQNLITTDFDPNRLIDSVLVSDGVVSLTTVIKTTDNLNFFSLNEIKFNFDINGKIKNYLIGYNTAVIEKNQLKFIDTKNLDLKTFTLNVPAGNIKNLNNDFLKPPTNMENCTTPFLAGLYQTVTIESKKI